MSSILRGITVYYLINKSNKVTVKLLYSNYSIVRDMKLPDNMISDKELGLLKLRYDINKAIFLSGKTYLLIKKLASYINKAKGLKSSSLVYYDY